MKVSKKIVFIISIFAFTVAIAHRYPYVLSTVLSSISEKLPIVSVLSHGKDGNLGVKFVRQLVGKSPNERTIMFAANDKKEYKIEYYKGGLSKTFRVKATDVSFSDGKDSYKQYMAKLSNLDPNSTYEYRIITDDANGSWHKLTVPGGKDFTALIFADSQSGDNYAKWERISSRAYNDNEDAQLYLNLGDQVDNGQHQYQWLRWFESIEKFSADIPMATLVGNHECYDLNWDERFPKAYVNLFQLPSDMTKYKNQFYSFDYGDVHFTCLDTNYRWEVLPYQPNIVWEQLEWAKRDLANSKAKWKVVLMHRDICMYGYNPNSGYKSDWRTYIMETGDDFMPIFERYGVDAVLSGHLHTYRRRVPIRNFRPDKERGITYIMSGVSGDQPKGLLWEDWSWDAKRSSEKPENGNYMTMQVKNNQLIFRAFLPNGNKFDEVVLKK